MVALTKGVIDAIYPYTAHHVALPG